MKGVYSKMESDWETYCLMCGIALIEEISKPTLYNSTKIYKGDSKKYPTFRTLRLKVKDYEIIRKFWEITRRWENKFHLDFIGNAFKNGPLIENYSGQYYFIFTPVWLFRIMKTIGKLPSSYTYEACVKRLEAMTSRRSGSKYLISKTDFNIIKNLSLFDKLFVDKMLAAGAFIVSFDLEFRGVQTAECKLTMSEKYEDFLNFMLNVAKKWNWTGFKKLGDVNITNSLKMGIKASPQKEFGVASKSLDDIYDMAGPLAHDGKDRFMRFHIKRIKNYNPSKKPKDTHAKILKYIKENSSVKAVDLQFVTGVRIDVVLDHLKKLESDGHVVRERHGKGYFWSLKR